MTNTTEKEIYIRPDYDDQGRPFYRVPNAKREENLVAVCLKPPVKVIPVIFIPGVMGSNLKNDSGKAWQYTFKELGNLIFAGGRKRKKLLDPNKTTVDSSGSIRDELADGKRFPTRRERGWGSAFYKSYGQALHKLQALLNDDDILMDNCFRETKVKTARQNLIGVSFSNEVAGSAISDEEVEHSYHFLYPLHVFGYNWLQSNEESAIHLGEYITNVVLPTYHGRLAVNKVILITHSMGGLVARHYSELKGGRENILGIIHGVMPDLGSPSAYRRMKTGEGGLVGMVIGGNQEQLMPVLAQSPGPLQLLPGTAYGTGWLRVQRGNTKEYLPLTDPYKDIYLNNKDWWRLYEAGISGGKLEEEWEAYKKLFSDTVRGFIEDLQGKYHPQTWLFYGASENNPSDASLLWKALPAKPVFSRFPQVTLPTVRRDGADAWQLVSSGEAGDGTVPVRSVVTTAAAIQGVLATDVEHEGAYAIEPADPARSLYRDFSDALVFTLRSLVKIVQQVSNK